MFHRLYEDLLKSHFKEGSNMALLSGPRQAGKTTTAKTVSPQQNSYWNWDDDDDRLALRGSASHFLGEILKRDGRKNKVLILDEIHKNPRWRNWLKGFYDKNAPHFKIIVTGSARLNVMSRGGDSLLGRYFHYRHHPLSLGELEGKKLQGLFRNDSSLSQNTLEDLFQFGGFPAPFISQTSTMHQKWVRTRRELLLREDVRDLSHIEDMAGMETLVRFLPQHVAGMLNMQNLSHDLHVTVGTVSRWISLLKNLYYAFTIPPYSQNIKRSLLKMPKIYLWDWSEVMDEAPRFENMVASHLLKAVHYWTDSGLGDYELFYLRDKQKREIDFLVTANHKPFMLVECKLSAASFNPVLSHYHNLIKPDYSLLVVKNLKNVSINIVDTPPCQILSASGFLGSLP